MYHAKNEGANRYLFFNDSMNKLAVKTFAARKPDSARLKRRLFYRVLPTENGHSQWPTGRDGSAGADFITPKRGLISPASFIPVV